MNKHHKITALERDQIAWWLACGITIREMAGQLGRSPCKVLNYQTPLEIFTAHFTESVRIGS
jgi:IS30 family transposase